MKLWKRSNLGVMLKLCLTNEACISIDLMTIQKDGDLISNKQELSNELFDVELFNEQYVNKVEKLSGKQTSVTRKFVK